MLECCTVPPFKTIDDARPGYFGLLFTVRFSCVEGQAELPLLQSQPSCDAGTRAQSSIQKRGARRDRFSIRLSQTVFADVPVHRWKAACPPLATAGTLPSRCVQGKVQ